jgi:hypothetical protein
MVDGVHLYIEGGGNDSDTRARLRQGLQQFLAELRERARSRRLRWNVTVCGGRDQAYRNSGRALRSQPNTFNVLLVDAEGPVDVRHRGRPWQHLRARDRWRRPATARDEHCHLLVQAMEAWLIADRERLEARFGVPSSAAYRLGATSRRSARRACYGRSMRPSGSSAGGPDQASTRRSSTRPVCWKSRGRGKYDG